ncbi:MAG: TIGR03086 family protein [Microthrixaceae bacterium]|nr:TIGR03086 family protein [Microthrixaceae bacterium]
MSEIDLEARPETIAERYHRLADLFADTVADVDIHRWNDPSPCEDWSVLDVLRHVIETQSLVAGFMGRELGPGPSPGSDPVGAWLNVSDQIYAQLQDPALALEQFDGLAEPMPWEQVVDKLLSFDLVVHRWDIGHGVDLPVVIDADDVEWAMAAAQGMGEDLRSEGVCGPGLEPSADADAQTRLLAFLGRRA